MSTSDKETEEISTTHEQQTEKEMLHGYKFYRSIGSPKFILAPMVEHSKLPFRLLTRNHGAELCYTPMINVAMFVKSEIIRKAKFSTCPEDRPLFVQLCGHDPEKMKETAQYILEQGDVCDAFDINLGCPQNCAKFGRYGSFLLEDTETIVSLIRVLLDNFNIPVTCKIRCLRSEEKTIALCKAIEKAGCSILTVHGRLKEHNKDLMSAANWDIIKKVKEALSIPVFANGGIRTLEDVKECMEYTGCDGVMTSEAILENPGFFETPMPHLEDLMLEYLELAIKYEELYSTARSHLYKTLYSGFKTHIDLRDRLSDCNDWNEMIAITQELKDRRQQEAPESKIEWYHRYWKNHETESAHSRTDFNKFISDFEDKESTLDRKQFEQKFTSKLQGIASLFDEGEGDDLCEQAPEQS